MSVDLLVQKIKEKGNPSVAGLDPVLDYVPRFIKDRAFAEYGRNLKGACEAIWEFNKGLIDARFMRCTDLTARKYYTERSGTRVRRGCM